MEKSNEQNHQSDEIKNSDQSQNKTLHPWQIKRDDFKTKEEIENAEKIIDEWTEDVNKQIHVILAKNGIKTYQISFVHEGMKVPIHLTTGNIYATALLAVHAARFLKDRVDKELTI